MSSIGKLYKYGRFNDYSEKLFCSNQIWFPKPVQLNDPFECRPHFTFDGTEAQVRDFLTTSFCRRHPDWKWSQINEEVERVFQLERYKSPEVLDAHRKEVLSALGQEIGIYCLSRVCDSILMWSHYASDHTGYCLEFEATDCTPVFGRALPVRYSDSYPTVDFFNTPNELQVDLIFLTKYTGWSYEQEFRIIDHEDGSGLKNYPAELLKGVIFGARATDANKAQVREWLQQRGHPAKLYNAVQHNEKFSLDIVPAE